jgi:hypothetical protein
VRRILTLLLVAGCGGSDGGADAGPDLAPPPMICKTPPPLPGSGWFTEVTSEMGLGTAAAPAALATSIRAGDLDGDGYPDLLATVGNPARETPGVRYRFLLMNRPSPSDPTKRVLVDATAASGLLTTRDGMGGRSFFVASLGDLDNDGDLDVAMCPNSGNSPDECAAFLNDGTAHFHLAPAGELEGAGAFESNGATLLDLDRDGVLDFWPATFGSSPWLFRGLGGGLFHDVSAAMGLPQVNGDPAQNASFRQTFGVTACDLDSDGDTDVILADYGREHNQVWRNDGTMLTEVGEMLGIAADDRMDYSDDQSYRCWCSANPGMCPMSIPAPIVTCPDRGWVPGQSDQPWRLGGNNFGIACADYDNDGDMDLMTATIVHWDVGSDSDPSELVVNDAPPGTPLMKFRRPGNAATGLARLHLQPDWNDGDMMPVFADVDLDGLADIYLTSSDYPGCHGWLWKQKPDHTFMDVTGPSGAGQPQIHGVALVDLDGDGDLDLVAGTSTARGVALNYALRVYENTIGQASNWLQVRLVGAGAGKANRSAIGARVTVHAGGVTQLQEVQGGSAHCDLQNDLVLTFGLGAACTVDAVEVRWPDAQASVQRVTGVQANYLVEIAQGQDGLRYVVR